MNKIMSRWNSSGGGDVQRLSLARNCFGSTDFLSCNKNNLVVNSYFIASNSGDTLDKSVAAVHVFWWLKQNVITTVWLLVCAYPEQMLGQAFSFVPCQLHMPSEPVNTGSYKCEGEKTGKDETGVHSLKPFLTALVMSSAPAMTAGAVRMIDPCLAARPCRVASSSLAKACVRARF